jgi:hypothetical protein
MTQCHIPEESNPQHIESWVQHWTQFHTTAAIDWPKTLWYWNIWTVHVIIAIMPCLADKV